MQCLPVGQARCAVGVLQGGRELGLVVALRTRDKMHEFAIRDEQDAVFVEPALEFGQERATVGAAVEGFAQPANDVATLVLGYLPETERLIGMVFKTSSSATTEARYST